MRGEEEEYERMRKRKLAQNKRNREIQKRGTRNFLNKMRNTSHKGG